MHNCYQKRLLVLVICVLALGAFAQKKSDARKTGGASGLNKAYLQKIWDGWGGLDGTKQGEFYAKGPHLFFDVAPLKYDSWDAYSGGVTKVFADYSGGKFEVNNDVEINPVGSDMAWVAGTVKADLTKKGGKREISTLRWTAIFHKEGGKWLIVHEHVSEPTG